MGSDPLAPQVERDILRLHLDRHPLAETTQGALSGAGSHRHRVLEISESNDCTLVSRVVTLSQSPSPVSEVKSEYCCRSENSPGKY